MTPESPLEDIKSGRVDVDWDEINITVPFTKA